MTDSRPLSAQRGRDADSVQDGDAVSGRGAGAGRARSPGPLHKATEMGLLFLRDHRATIRKGPPSYSRPGHQKVRLRASPPPQPTPGSDQAQPFWVDGKAGLRAM